MSLEFIALSRLLCCDFSLIFVFLLQLLSSLNIDIYELEFFYICPPKTQKQPWNFNVFIKFSPDKLLKSNISYIHKMLNKHVIKKYKTTWTDLLKDKNLTYNLALRFYTYL